MDTGRNNYCCIFCQRSYETKTTGNLLNKDDVTAHQYCLLYSSGLFCTSTPEYDELYGFSVEDVKKEAKRGRQLSCSRCKKRGATSGCEVRRCKKTFHYPCAVEEGAKIIGNRKTEQYTLFCLKHSLPPTENGDSTNKSTVKTPSEAGTSTDHCPACQKSEGNIRLESLSKSILMSYCDKHAPSSHKKKTNDKSSAVKPSPSCSSSSSRTTLGSFKRRLSFTDQQKGKSSSKKKNKSWNRIQSDGSSDSGMENLIPPLESDFDESVNSLSQKQSAEPRCNSTDSEITPGFPAGNEVEVETTEVNKDENEVLSDAESESLLRPLVIPIPLQSNGEVSTLSISAEHSGAESVEKEVQTIKREVEDYIPIQSPIHLPEEHTDEPSSRQRSFTEPPPSQEPPVTHLAPESPPHTGSTFELALCEPICVTLVSSSPSQQSTPSDTHSDPTEAPPSDPAPSIDSTHFWRNCNMARCTQALFSEFINEMNELSSRILSDQASQEDCDRALSVMLHSGRFEAFIAKHQEELQRKQEELQKEAAAMKDVISALRK